MGNPKALRLARNRWSSVKASGRGRSFMRRGRFATEGAAVESFRRKLALVAVGQATAILIFAGWLAYVIDNALLRGGSWRGVWLVPPLLAATSAVVVTLWKIAERLSLSPASLRHRPDAIRALTGQYHRRTRGGATEKEGEDAAPPGPA
jgi:hypothetical protein